MNCEDKKRFARYRKDYIIPSDEEIEDNLCKIGQIDKVEINKSILIDTIIDKSKKININDVKKMSNNL